MKIIKILILLFLLLFATPSIAQVLIIQDTPPWGLASIQNILSLHSVSYNQITSAEIAATDLSLYKMIVLPSVQEDSSYINWNANIAKIETYVKNGGKLWQSTCNYNFLSSETEPMIPGGVESSTDMDFYNTLTAPDHPWVKGVSDLMYGESANHDSFTNLYPGSTIIATTQTSGKPVLVDFRYGAGRVLITGQTLEYASSNDWDGAPILENSIVHLYNSVDDVLIVQDQLPWSSTAIQDTLDLNGINYDQVTSSQLAATDLSPYSMLIIPSVQGNTFYGNWNSSITKIETYVQNGGKLWQSTCNQASSTEPLVPGGVESSSDPNSYNDILDTGHPWVRGVPNPMLGSSANHDSFNNLYPGSTVVATAQISGKPVLVDFRYGAGRVLITGQTLEYAWNNNQDGKPILENSLVDLFNSLDDVLIIQDKYPWSSTAIQDILSLHDIAYDQITSAKIATTDLSPYVMIIVPSVQGSTFYTNWNSSIAKIETYVQKGGKFWQSTCNNTSPEPLIPGGVISSDDFDNYNLVAAQNHSWAQGVPSPMYGNNASHNSFMNLYPGSIVIATAQTSGKPVLAEYRYGSGRVLITGQTLEFAWESEWDAKPILENSLLGIYRSKKFPWNLFLPAILGKHAKP